MIISIDDNQLRESNRVLNQKLLYKVLLLTIPVIGMTTVSAEEVKFKPSNEPVFSTPRAKPNIHMVLDDSGSMKGSSAKDVTLDGKKVERREALNYAYKALMNKYKDKAYIGVSFLWQAYPYDSNLDPAPAGLMRLPVADYSKKTLAEIENDYDISRLILNAPGGTPMYPGVYEAIKMFRGQPVTARGVNSSNVDLKNYEINGEKKEFYPAISQKSPVRFRCQQNHMIVMTDGLPNRSRVWGIDMSDGLTAYSSVNKKRQYVVGNVNLSAYADISTGFISKNPDEKDNHINILGKIAADTDLRNYQKSVNDEAGKPWFTDEYAKAMPIYMHTVSLAVDPKSPIYIGLTSAINKANNKEHSGMNLGFEKGKGNAEDLLLAFDTIFSSIILSTSSTLSMNDRIHSDMLTRPPFMDANGNVDLTSLGTIRYDTIYDFRQNFGSVRARVPYQDPVNKDEKGNPIILQYELWSTDKSITPDQGRYVTLLDKPKETVGSYLSELTDQDVLTQFKKIDPNFKSSYITWLTDFKKSGTDGLRARLNPLGSITNSDIVTVNKDVLNISAAKEKMSAPLRKELSNWLLYKANYQPKNLLIVGDNDGFISFINAQRGLTGSHKGGHRDTAYFPKMLVHRFDEIAEADRVQTLVMEGKTDLVDAKVRQLSGSSLGGDYLYATLGLTGMGGGGKGLVGYRIYAETESAVKNWAKNKQTAGETDPNSIYKKVTPLFEITNEGPNKTPGFEDLGYTYSGFEFFNRISGKQDIPGLDTHLEGQAVAIFGNGFGTEKSVLYFIDAYTGEKLHQIVLDPKGLGAGTPSIVVNKDDITGGQKIDRIYVGDYSGTLYKIDFPTSNFKANDVTVTALFKTPETNYGQSAISVKPLVVKAKNSNLYRVFFGTGMAASYDLDRYKHSLVTHGIYGITDLANGVPANSRKFANESNRSLMPALTVANLKKGRVNYAEGVLPDYEKLDRYELELNTPTKPNIDNTGNKYEDGWYVILSADNPGIKNSTGTNSEVGEIGSGERVILNPQYDSRHDAVVFSTWGVRERGDFYDDAVKNDPCVSDLAFGKVLSFYAGTGGGSFEIGIANAGKTGTAEGTLTGDDVESAPEGNTETKLEDLEIEVQEELEEAVDAENSTYETDRDKSGVYCVGGINGQSECVEIKRTAPVGSDPIRLSIQTLFSS